MKCLLADLLNPYSGSSVKLISAFVITNVKAKNG
ncbi:hypothetical protein FHT71_003582 [Rhizobium sp. BK060]|nr:hypothetical protein [Rhizobium sp. BK060]